MRRRLRLTKPGAAVVALLVWATACHLSIEPVVDNEFDQVAPAVDGSLVVWEDYRHDEDSLGSDVYMRDMSGGDEVELAGGRGDQESPAVSDRYIVWVDGRTIYARERVTGDTITVAKGSGDRFDPAVCGDLVTWSDMRSGNSDIYARRLPSGSEMAIATTTATEGFPDCDEGRIVYMRATTERADIYLHDTATGQTSLVSATQLHEWRPAISDDIVVWQTWPVSQGIDIRGKDLATGTDLVISDDPDDQTAPDVSGVFVVYVDKQHGALDIARRNVVTGKEDYIALGPESQRSPAVSGNRTVFQDHQEGDWDILSAVG